MIKYFKHKGKYLFACFMILFAYVLCCLTSFSVSASGSFSDSYSEGFAAPVSITANYVMSDVRDSLQIYTASMTVTPNITYNFDEYSVDFIYGEVGDSTKFKYDYHYNVIPSSSISYLERINGYNSLAGYYQGSFFGPKIDETSLNVDFRTLTYYFSPFYCWGSDAFDSYVEAVSSSLYDDRFNDYLDDYNCEILFDVYSNNVSFPDIEQIRIGYQKVGEEFSHELTLTDSFDSFYDEKGYYMVTPSLFGDDDLTAVYYISYFEITFEDSPTAISSWDPTFDFCYTLNPFIQEYVFLILLQIPVLMIPILIILLLVLFLILIGSVQRFLVSLMLSFSPDSLLVVSL